MIRLIDITDDDIKNGVQGECDKCAIALALKREYKTDDVFVHVTDDTSTPCLQVNKKDLNFRYENDVLDFIDCYDNMSTEDDYFKTPKPFTLEVVEWKN